MTNATAGKYLRTYERSRYTLLERYLPAITVPHGAVEFPDVSFWQKPINFAQLAKKTKAVILRVGQGTVKDSEFEYNYEQAKAHGLKVGGYHFYDGRVSPANQAVFVVEALRGKTLDLELFADWERHYGLYDGLHNVVSFMQSVENRVNAKDIGMYSGYYWFRENSDPKRHTGEFLYLKRKPLWIAWYASPAIVKVPPPWDAWTHWQKGTPAIGGDMGVGSKEIDMNNYNGDAAAFAVRYGASEAPTQPPPAKVRRLVIEGDFTWKEE
jgi:lysozyme